MDMDILIVKLGALGDVVNTLPLAITLKKQLGAHIHWVVEPLSYPLVAHHRCVDSTIVFDKHNWIQSLPGVIRQIRKQRFDICLDLQRIIKSGLLCLASRSTRRIGFDQHRCKEMTGIFPFDRIPASDPGRHMLLQYLEFAEYLGIQDHAICWNIPVDEHVPSGLPSQYLVLNIGATKEANKWTPQGFASLAMAISGKYSVPCVLTGVSQDRAMADTIIDIAGKHVIDLVGKTSLQDLINVLNGSLAVVSCDTGPMHLGVALGREVIALFGPADPSRTGPYRGHVIKKQLHCSPCNKRACKDPVCMTSIRSEDVMEKIDLVLKAHGLQARSDTTE
ncbi:MAG TPA: glycosyltransferase family 9 protein [Deltaproteobacteria bacterium]|nr:glycosyltransferase family 9 protein [Deltaproteobacteria bacterium]